MEEAIVIEEIKEEPKIKANPIAVSNGMLVAKNAIELGAVLTQIATGGGFPKRFETKEKRLAVYNLGFSLMGNQWQMALNNIAEINGQLSIYGELPGTLAERTGEVGEKEVYLVDADYKRICLENKNLSVPPFAAICKIQRRGRVLKEYTYTLDQAKKAGQYPPMKNEWVNNKRTGKQIQNEDSPWSTHLEVMLMRKAMALAIKFEFPEALCGVPIAEWDHHAAPDYERDVTKSNGVDKADLINKKFAKPVHTAAPVPGEG